MIQLALRSALSDRAAEGKVVVVELLAVGDTRTKDARAALDALGLTGKVLVVLARTDEEAYKSFRNLPGVQLLLAGELNAYDILCNDWIVFTPSTLPGGRHDVGRRPWPAPPLAGRRGEPAEARRPRSEPEAVTETAVAPAPPKRSRSRPPRRGRGDR